MHERGRVEGRPDARAVSGNVVHEPARDTANTHTHTHTHSPTHREREREQRERDGERRPLAQCRECMGVSRTSACFVLGMAGRREDDIQEAGAVASDSSVPTSDVHNCGQRPAPMCTSTWRAGGPARERQSLTKADESTL